jgi:hypothetical protein
LVKYDTSLEANLTKIQDMKSHNRQAIEAFSACQEPPLNHMDAAAAAAVTKRCLGQNGAKVDLWLQR